MLNILCITIAIYLFFMLMGWGVTRLILPASTRPYQLWLAPWLGLIITDISVVWFSRIGLETNRSIYLISLLGIGLLVLCKLRKVSLSLNLKKFDAILAFGSLLALFLALYPMVSVYQYPTTISLGNNDPVDYAILGDWLKSHGINQSPSRRLEHPSTALISALLAPGVRPGTWLLFGLIASLFNLQIYQIFSITLNILFALTPSLISVFTWVATTSYFAALIALTLSVLNVNLLFFNYHGFGAQVPAQGCLILAFFLLYMAEQSEESDNNYFFPLGLALSSLFTFYAEIVPFFLAPYALYVVLRLMQKRVQKIKLIKNLTLISAVTILIDPLSFWYGLQYTMSSSGALVGWPMPRWAFPVDMIGLLNIHSDTTQSFWLLVASLPIIGLIAIGINNLSNKTLWLSLLIFTLAVLLWLSFVRGYSYGYYKAIGFLTFAVIIYFSTGLASIVRRYSYLFGEIRLQFGTICLILLLSTLAVLPTFQAMINNHLSVTPELRELAEVSKIAKNRKIFLDLYIHWDEMWAVNFLGKSRIAFLDVGRPSRYADNTNLSSSVESGGLYLTRNWYEGFIDTDELLWQNATYSLLLPGGKKKINIRLGKNWWFFENWWGDTSASKSFRWMNQDAHIEIENKQSQELAGTLKIKFIPILPKTTVDVYLNNYLIKTIQVKNDPQFYSISCQLKVGDSQLRFHVKEGVIKPPGDFREIALGVNAIRFVSN
jgi:hypothetical protein